MAMDQASTAETSDRRALDVFDPSHDGHTGHTLEQTLRAAQDVLDSVTRFEVALEDCMTPLNLHGQLQQAQKAAKTAAGWVETLGKTRDIVEGDLPLGDTVEFPGEFHDMDLPWTGPGNANLVLSPDEIIKLNIQARGLPLDRLTTYRRETEGQGKVPSIVRTKRRLAKRNAGIAAQAAARRAGPENRYSALGLMAAPEIPTADQGPAGTEEPVYHS